MDVDYGLDVPIFPDEFYTVRNSLKHVEDNSYMRRLETSPLGADEG